MPLRASPFPARRTTADGNGLPLPRVSADVGKRFFDNSHGRSRRPCAASRETEIGGIHGDQGRHHHCSWCKSWVYTEAVAHPESIYVRATLLDDPYWFAPWVETQTAEKLAWAVTGAQRSFARFPEEFEALVADYRKERYWSDP